MEYLRSCRGSPCIRERYRAHEHGFRKHAMPRFGCMGHVLVAKQSDRGIPRFQNQCSFTEERYRAHGGRSRKHGEAGFDCMDHGGVVHANKVGGPMFSPPPIHALESATERMGGHRTRTLRSGSWKQKKLENDMRPAWLKNMQKCALQRGT